MNESNSNSALMGQAAASAAKSHKTLIAPEALERALAIEDLSEEGERPHAVGLIVREVLGGMAGKGWPLASRVRGERVVDARDNYALLGYDPSEITLGSEHTRWVSPTTLLRTQTTSLIPQALREAAARRRPGERVMVAAAGITYRRDVRDRLHCAEPHQLDLWLLCDAAEATDEALRRWVGDAMEAAVPGAQKSLSPSPHHYTEGGMELNVHAPEGDVETLECGRIARSLLSRLGIDPDVHGGLALGMGLDRAAMLRKGIPDIRLLRDPDPRIAAQMRDLSPWRPVSKQPAARRDLSLAVRAGQSEEALTERLLAAAGERARWVEAAALLGRWSEADLPEQAKERLGLLPGQENVLLRVELRDWARSIPKAEANALYAALQEALHDGRPGGGYKLPTGM
jgi:phenylalanyl-tRNA synthetase alpha chain